VQTTTHTITREPVHPGYDTLGDADNWGEDFYLLINGNNIGTTWYCSAAYVKDGQRWASDGPAGLSMGHPTREAAEQVQLKAAGHAATTVTTQPGPAPAPEPSPLPVTWEEALAEAKGKGVGRCSDHAAMAAFCDASITYIVGAVSGQLIWEGAMKKGLSFKELGRLANRDPMACSELMWL
jgi:hypothetical protein